GILGAGGCDPDLLRVQHDLLSAIHPRRARHAAPLSRVRARAPGLERAVVGRGLDPGGRLSFTAVLSRLVLILGTPRQPQSVAGDRARMADALAAPAAQFRRHSRGEARALQLRTGGTAAECL